MCHSLSPGRGTGSLGEGFAGRGYLKGDRFFVVREGRVRGGRQRTLSWLSVRQSARVRHSGFKKPSGVPVRERVMGVRARSGGTGMTGGSGAEAPVDDRRAVRDRRVTRRRPGVNMEKILGIGR